MTRHLLYRLTIVCLLLAAMPLLAQVPYQVKVINPTYSASIRDAVGMNGIGYFVAGSYVNFSNGQWDEELWRTDGTEAGTFRVKDIRAGLSGSNIKWMTVVGNTLYFSANDGTSGDELWKSDGTEPGTVRVVELNVGSGDGSLRSLVDYNGVLHFIGTYANGSTYLFRSDGTAAGTVPVSTAVTPYAPTFVDPNRRLTVWNGYLWFMGYDIAFTSSGLYRSDGTSAGTTLITTLNSPGSDMVAGTNQLFFTANDPTYRREVWRSDGTAAGTYMTKDLNPINSGFNGDSSAWIYWTVGDVVLFSGVDGNPGFNRKLYRSDGTAGGTWLLADIYPGFSDVTNGPRTNADRTYMVWESRQQGGSSAPHLYVTDGTIAGTVRLKTFLSFCQNFMAMDGVMYFRASDGSAAGGAELWRTNGTVAGTYRYADINPGPNGSDPYPVGFFGNIGLLHAGPSYPQLWAFRLCNSAPQPVVSFSPATVCAGNGAGTATVTNAASFTTFNWTIVNGAFDSATNGSSVSFHATSSSAVQLTVTATGDGCQQQATVSIPTVAAPAATITPSGPTTFCEGGSVTLTSSTAASYSWSNGATTQSITVNASGSYSVTTTNSNDCSTTSTPTVVAVNAAPDATITTAGPTTFCEGGSVTLTAAAGMASYVWSTGATTQSVTVNASGNYTVSVTNASGCSALSSATPVTVNPLPSPVITVSNQYTLRGPATNSMDLVSHSSTLNYCGSVDINLIVSQPQNYTSFLWSTGATTPSIHVTGAGTYTVTVTNANGCSASDSVTISVTPTPPAPVITASSPELCPNGSVTLTSSAADSYLWSTGATTQSITVTEPGSYSVSVNVNGCSSPSSSINFAPRSVEVTASGPTTFCNGGSVTLTSSAADSYLWSTGATTQSISVTSSGNYTVTAGFTDGCSITSAPVPVTVGNISTSISADRTTLCPGNSIHLTSSVSGGPAASYQWYTTGIPISGATSATLTLTPANGGYVYLKVTDANGCTATSNAVVYSVSEPSASITALGPTTFCEGSSTTLMANAGASYLWSTGATSPSINVTQSGSYSVTVTNADGCSATSAATVVTVNANPATPAITAGGPTTFCEGGSVTLSAPAGYTYVWSNGATTQSITVNASGSYSVTVSNGNCTATSAPATVTVNAKPATPAITASGPTTFCQGDSVTLTAPAGLTYLWSTGATTQSINVAASGSYSVTVTNASSCSAASAATVVTVNAKPATPTITASGPTTFCAGGSVTLTAPTGYTYLWSNNATTQSIIVSASGSYSVAVTNASGCSTTSSPTTVTVNPLPPATITASGPTTFCPGGSVTLTAPAGYTYLWSNNATTQSIVVSAGGSYNVMVSNGNCSATSAPTAVTVNPPTVITAQPQNVTMRRSETRVLSVTATGTPTLQYQWYEGLTGDTSKPVGTGSQLTIGPYQKKGTYRYWVRVTSSTCSGSVANSTTATVTVNN